MHNISKCSLADTENTLKVIVYDQSMLLTKQDVHSVVVAYLIISIPPIVTKAESNSNNSVLNIQIANTIYNVNIFITQ